MGFPKAKDLERRLPVYSYARPAIEGRRVLELGSGSGRGAEHLLDLGAAVVVSVDGAANDRPGARSARVGITFLTGFAAEAIERHAPFDLIVVPDGKTLFAGTAPYSLAAVRTWLGRDGRLLCAAGSVEAFGPGAGVDYYAMLDALSPHFPVVRMFGQTPFVALGIAEFDAAAGGLRVDAGLVDPDSETPTHYVALAGADEGPALGYALVQVPFGTALGPHAVAAPPPVASQTKSPSVAAAPVGELEALRKRLAEIGDDKERQVRELSRKLVEVEGRADGVLRVSRAQSEEIEELRARLRRAAELRADLDEEVARLRRSLAEADESVIHLTRKTADEMSALAQQLTSSLRPALAVDRRAESGETALLVEQLKQRDAELAKRESALFERDERVAALEIEKQDLLWQIDAAAARRGTEAAFPAAVSTAEIDSLREAMAARDRTVRELQRAAVVHMREIERARAESAEHAAYVLELQEALAAAEARADVASREAERLRVLVAETQDADRSRRSRLAELEGKLLRIEREAHGPGRA